MISDEELKRAAECDIESEVTQFCGVIGLSVIDPKVMLEAGVKMQKMARELLQLREEKRTPCRWEQDMDGNWQTGCDNMFVLNDGTPTVNGMKFCAYCGHRLEEMV